MCGILALLNANKNAFTKNISKAFNNGRLEDLNIQN